ncbi:hypothetical protein ACF05T_02385 [Streptomyces lateritius]|uniref:DUF2946 domain-containing protein n=1 Tax=Streptomyces lateritius TaxID=67313 RepID=A0ABW6Y565_9ACTN
MGGTPLVRPFWRARPMALVSAVATLLAALFVCLGAGDAATHDMAGRAAHAAHTTATVTVVADEYVCPYDRGDCSLFPSLGPAVLTAPPLDPPPHAEGRLPRLAPSYETGWAPRPGAQPRAPDLHVLQVLRT